MIDKEKQAIAMNKLQKIALEILHNDKEPHAQKLIFEWITEYYPTWFKTTASVPFPFQRNFKLSRHKVTSIKSAKQKKGDN